MFRTIAAAGAAAIMAFLLGGCATVSTEVVPLGAVSGPLPPSRSVQVLLDKPKEPYREIALLETQGQIGDGEAKLLQDARRKARALGADAIVRLEVDKTVHPPVAVYDPFFDPFYPGFALYRPYYYSPAYYDYRVIPGGVSYTVKTLAIKFLSNGARQG